MASGQAEIVSSTKDSIYIRWRFDADKNRFANDGNHPVSGYMVSFQAVGSSVIQTVSVGPSTSDVDITQLHENTNYNICVLRTRDSRPSLPNGASSLPIMTSAVSTSTSRPVPIDSVDKACIRGTTATDSLSVALGSTFGAFLALGLIVALVFAAKWQHARRVKKRLGAASMSEVGAEIDDIEDVFRAEEPMSANEDSEMLAGLASDSVELGPAPGSDNRSSGSEPDIPISMSYDSCCRRPSVPHTAEDASGDCCNDAQHPRSSSTGEVDNAATMSPSSPVASEPRPFESAEHVAIILEQSPEDIT